MRLKGGQSMVDYEGLKDNFFLIIVVIVIYIYEGGEEKNVYSFRFKSQQVIFEGKVCRYIQVDLKFVFKDKQIIQVMKYLMK